MHCPWRRPCWRKMEYTQLSVAILAVIMAISVQTAYGISCYECNSHKKYEGKPCGDPMDASLLELVDCNEKYGAKYGQNYTMCRKMQQNVEGDKRISRSCAIEGKNKCIDRTGTKAIAVRYCECFGDGCNTASSLVTATSLIIASLLATLAIAIRS